MLERDIAQLRAAGVDESNPKLQQMLRELEELKGVDPTREGDSAEGKPTGTDANDPPASGEVECEAIPGVTDKFEPGKQQRCVTVALANRDRIMTFITDRGQALGIYFAHEGGGTQTRVADIPTMPGLAEATITVADDGVIHVDDQTLAPADWFSWTATSASAGVSHPPSAPVLG